MQTKSWQIALIGLIPLIISNFTFLYNLFAKPCVQADCTLSLFPSLLMLGFLDLFAAIIVFLLKSERRKNVGIILSLSSVIFILGLFAVSGGNIGILSTLILVIWPAFFLGTAGIYCTLKKV